MSELFISYAREDRDRAAQLAEALSARGWGVWWDRAIPAGRQFDEVIEEALTRARCVLVLWSPHSVASGWVKTEAGEALARQVLVPVLLDAAVKIPLEFRRVQAADLSAWAGDAADPAFVALCAAVEPLLQAPPGPAPAPQPAPAPAPRPVPPSPGPAPVPVPGPVPAPRPWWRGPKGWAVAAGVVVLAAAALWAPPTADAVPVSFRDYILAYQGQLSWDGQDSQALLQLSVTDQRSGQVLVPATQVPARVLPQGGGMWVFQAQVTVPGDSQTPGPHSHGIGLVMQRDDSGHWVVLRNCMAPGQCW